MRPSAGRFNLSTGGGLLAIVLWSATIAMARSLSEQLWGGCVVIVIGSLVSWRSLSDNEIERRL